MIQVAACRSHGSEPSSRIWGWLFLARGGAGAVLFPTQALIAVSAVTIALGGRLAVQQRATLAPAFREDRSKPFGWSPLLAVLGRH